MKKLILIMALAIACIHNVDAQITMTGSDTIVDAATVSVSQKITTSLNVISFQAVVTKLSGTVAGTVILQASNDAVNYVDISTDTLTLTDVTTNTFLWSVTSAPYQFYRLTGLGTGTMSAIISGFAVARKN